MQSTADPSPRTAKDIAAWIKEGINTGRYRPGEPLPTYDELRRAIGTSNATLAKAIRSLKEQRWLLDTPSRGRLVVADRTPWDYRVTDQMRDEWYDQPLDEARDVFTTSAGDHRPTSGPITVERTYPPEFVRARMGIRSDEMVLVRCTYQEANGETAVIETGYYQLSMAIDLGIDRPTEVTEGISRLIAATLTWRHDGWITETTGRGATEDECAAFGLQPEALVIENTMTCANINGATAVVVRVFRPNVRVVHEVGKSATLDVIRTNREA